MDNIESKTSVGDRIEDFLEYSIVNNIAKGISIALGIAFGVIACVAIIGAIAVDPWYWAAFIICCLLCGLCIGFSVYLFDEY